MKIYLDFESRSQCDIWKSGAWVYSKHPTTEILCLAYAVDNGEIQLIKDVANPKNVLLFNSYQGCEFHAHNAFFERAIWQNIMVPKYGYLPIPIKQWRCTAAKCMAHALPRSLEKAAIALRCTHQKDMSGSRNMKAIAYTTGVIPLSKLENLYEYCKNDVLVEREIDQKLPDLDPGEQKVWFMDQYINDTGICVDIEAVNKAEECIKLEVERLTEELKELTGGEVNAGTQRDAVKNWLEKKGCVLPDLTKNTVAIALASADGSIKRALRLRQQLSLTSNAKYSAIRDTVSEGRVREMLVYHGASTGRWAGKLVQIQNLPRPKTSTFNNETPIKIIKQSSYSDTSLLYGDDLLDVLSGCIRGMFIPSSGNDMFITDFAAIEARVVMWLAGEERGVKMFADQDLDPTLPDTYVHMARVVYNNDKLTKKNKQERQLGKQIVLAAGYGMGHVKFQATCLNYNMDVTKEMAEKCIKAYRNTFKKVCGFWYAMEEAAKRAVLTKNPQQVGKILWYLEGEFLRMKLPVGRTLAYHHPRVNAENKLSFMTENPVTKKYLPEDTWGGTLVENATQAVARDLMVAAMFQLITSGFRILFTVHDELVLEAVKGTKTVDDVLKCVRSVPIWAKGCPINAECEKTERYKK